MAIFIPGSNMWVLNRKLFIYKDGVDIFEVINLYIIYLPAIIKENTLIHHGNIPWFLFITANYGTQS